MNGLKLFTFIGNSILVKFNYSASFLSFIVILFDFSFISTKNQKCLSTAHLKHSLSLFSILINPYFEFLYYSGSSIYDDDFKGFTLTIFTFNCIILFTIQILDWHVYSSIFLTISSMRFKYSSSSI